MAGVVVLGFATPFVVCRAFFFGTNIVFTVLFEHYRVETMNSQAKGEVQIEEYRSKASFSSAFELLNVLSSKARGIHV